MMELLFLLLLGALLLIFVEQRSLAARIRQLEDFYVPGPVAEPAPALERPAAAVDPGDAFAWPGAPEAAPEVTEAAKAAEAAPHEIRLGDAPDADEAPPETLGALFERWVAGRLLIWLG